MSAALARAARAPVVNVSIDRGNGPADLCGDARAVLLPARSSRRMLTRNGVGYLRILQLRDLGHGAPGRHRAAWADLDRRLADLDVGGAQGLVLDLRNNGGGSVQTADELLGRFLPNTTRSLHESDLRGHDSYNLTFPAACTRSQVPMAVLINGSSASASEINSGGAARWAHRAIVVGEHWAGAVASSGLIPLPGGGGLQDSRGRGQRTLDSHRSSSTSVGITPDVETSSADARRSPTTVPDVTHRLTTRCRRWPISPGPAQVDAEPLTPRSARPELDQLLGSDPAWSGRRAHQRPPDRGQHQMAAARLPPPERADRPERRRAGSGRPAADTACPRLSR